METIKMTNGEIVRDVPTHMVDKLLHHGWTKV